MSSNQRDIQVDWRLFSLAYKNGELKGEKSYADHMPSHRVERVILAASKSGASVIDLYTRFGIKHFISGNNYSDDVIKETLSELKLDAELAKSADDETLDDELIASSESALKAVGNDIGVPTIVFTLEDGSERGFFGPVIKELPDQEESVKLWDSIVELAKNSSFFEIKRGRDGDPDVYSTAKC